MQKKPYQKPQLKEVKLNIEDTLLSSCKVVRNATGSSRISRQQCRTCRGTYAAS
jgi:hypothetical protein